MIRTRPRYTYAARKLAQLAQNQAQDRAQARYLKQVMDYAHNMEQQPWYGGNGYS